MVRSGQGEELGLTGTAGGKTRASVKRGNRGGADIGNQVAISIPLVRMFAASANAWMHTGLSSDES